MEVVSVEAPQSARTRGEAGAGGAARGGSAEVATLPWRKASGEWMLTVVCKATFDLSPPVMRLSGYQAPIVREERRRGEGASVFCPSDLDPFKKRVDVTVVGHCFAPERRRVSSLVARLQVGAIDKRIEVVGARAWKGGELTAGEAFDRMSLAYENAAGGPNTSNPVGIAATTHRVPNLQPAGGGPKRPGDRIAPIGFGPLAGDWPPRRAHLRGQPTWSPAELGRAPLPDLDERFFNVAPPDQQLDELSADEAVLLENLHPRYPRLETRLPGLSPHATVERPGRAPEPLEMRLDTLWIDTDRSLCILLWRGQLAITEPAEQGKVLVVLGRAKESSDDARRAAGASAPPSSIVDEPTDEGTSAEGPGDDEDRFANTQTLAGREHDAAGLAHTAEFPTGSEPASDRSPPPPPARSGSVPPARSGSVPPARSGSVPPPRPGSVPPPRPGSVPPPPGAIAPPAPGSTRRPATVPPPPPGKARRGERPRPPSVPPPRDSEHTAQVVIASSDDAQDPLTTTNTAGEGTHVLDASPAWLNKAEEAAAMPPAIRPPAARDSFNGLPFAPAMSGPGSTGPASSPGAMSPGPASSEVASSGLASSGLGAPPPIQPPAQMPPPPSSRAVDLGYLEAGKPSARREQPYIVTSSPEPPPVRTEPAPTSARRPTRTGIAPDSGEITELLWFEPSVAPRLRARWSDLVDELEFSPEDPKHDLQTDDPVQARSHHNTFGVLTRAPAEDAAGISRAMQEAVGDAGRFTPPLVLVGGVLKLPFSELETLKATAESMAPLAPTDKRLKDLLDEVAELLKTPLLQGGASVALSLTQQLRDQFSEAKRSRQIQNLESSIERVLLEERRYQMRKVFGGNAIRALLSVPGDTNPIPTYLPEDVGPKLPLVTEMRIRAIAEAHMKQDQDEKRGIALRVLALGRISRLEL